MGLSPSPGNVYRADCAAAPLTDAELLEQFEKCTLPRDQWLHATHVRVAYIYLSRCSFEVALEKMRSGIQSYNAVTGVVDGPHAGYHETITQAWLRLVASTMRHHDRGLDSDDFCRLQPHLLQRSLLRLFYSRTRIMSPAAKRSFIEADLAPLPAVDS
jgi:hypothetical protein